MGKFTRMFGLYTLKDVDDLVDEETRELRFALECRDNTIQELQKYVPIPKKRGRPRKVR